jgi:hypothetical protein
LTPKSSSNTINICRKGGCHDVHVPKLRCNSERTMIDAHTTLFRVTEEALRVHNGMVAHALTAPDAIGVKPVDSNCLSVPAASIV